MSKIKVSLPDQVDSDIQRLVERGEFLNRDQAVEDLLKRGISAYNTTTEETETFDEEIFDQTAAEQQDPASQDDFL